MIVDFQLGVKKNTTSGSGWYYRIAGCAIRSNIPIREISAFEIEYSDLCYNPADSVSMKIPASREPSFGEDKPGTFKNQIQSIQTVKSKISDSIGIDHGRLVYNGSGRIGNKLRNVECRLKQGNYQLNIAGVGIFIVAMDGSRVTINSTVSNAPPDLIMEALLGPALILAISLRGSYCLHASAVTVGNMAVAFMGDSGSGKSTLAAYLGSQPRSGWRQIADDVLPVEPGINHPAVLPHFPQLKLLPEAQVTEGQIQQIPLIAIYCLKPLADKPDGSATVRTQRCQFKEAMLSLIRHTVAARLFDAHLLKLHMTFCGDVTGQIPIRNFKFPKQYEFLPVMRGAIEADLNVKKII